jgi:transmembrane sensor
MLIFHDRLLSDVVDEVNRYRPGRIVIMNAELGRRVVNGTFYMGRLDDFIDQVQQLFGARVRSLPAGLILLS